MPPITRNAARRIARTKAETGTHVRGKLWFALRVLKTFTAGDLQAVCEIENKRSVLTFLGQLRRAGYLRASHGNQGAHEPTRFQLIRDSGPMCPALVRRGKAIFDHNTEQEYSINASP